MTFLGLVTKNLFRQRVRAGLTLLGISIGITTVVALGVITEGFKASAADILQLGNSDFMVAQKGSADLSFSTVPGESEAAVAALPGVERAAGALFYITKVGDNPFFVMLGMEPGALETFAPPLREGRLLEGGGQDDIVLGEGAANALAAGVGDEVVIGDHAFTVVGVYGSNALWENNGAYAALPTVQALAGKPDTLTVIYVTVAEGYDKEEVAKAIEESFPRLVTILSVSEYGEVDQGIEILDAANMAISLLAVGIGAIGVMNTMVMSVFERTREIGILRALGWSGSRVLRMVLTESLMLCMAASVIGTGLGLVATRAVLFVPVIENFLEPQYPMAIFVRAVIVGVVVALTGAAYPAYRAVRLTPMEALRYE